MLKDKLIAAERFTEPHYQRAAERYVQTVFRVLAVAQPGRPAQLDEVVALMDPQRLALTLRDLDRDLAGGVLDYVAGLTPDQQSAIRGLGTRLAVLSESEAGAFLLPARRSRTHTIDLGRPWRARRWSCSASTRTCTASSPPRSGRWLSRT